MFHRRRVVRLAVPALILALVGGSLAPAHAADPSPAQAPAPPPAAPLTAPVKLHLDLSALDARFESLDDRLDAQQSQLVDLRDQVMLLAQAPADPPAAGSGHVATRRPLPLTGVNVMPPSANSTNWVFGDLLNQAQYIDNAWRAFTGAANRQADYPHAGFIIDPPAAAQVVDTTDGLIIRAAADARERGVHVFLPGATPDELFHPIYLKRLAPFGILRFAHWLDVEQDQPPDWRRLAVSILLSNANDSSPWYTMADHFSDEDVRRMATMVRRGLDPDRPIYVEWAYAPPTDAPADEQAPASLDDWAKRAAHDFAIWREVFVDQPQRIVRVAAGPIEGEPALAELAAALGADGFDALACDARLSITGDHPGIARLIRQNDLTESSLLLLLEQLVANSAARYEPAARVAAEAGVPLLAYAAGYRVALSQEPGRTVGLAVQRHPRMYGLYIRQAQQWLKAQKTAGMGDELIQRGALVYAADVAPVDDHGVAGALEYQDQPLARAPRYRAMAALGADPRLARRAPARTPEAWTPVPLDSGWTALSPSMDTRVIYVSSTRGNDQNDGLSPQTPVRTPDQGYALMRDGHPDWLLFRRGDEFSMPDDRYGPFRTWAKSGRSETEPMLIASYGDPNAPQPTFLTNGRGFLELRFDQPIAHLVFSDLHLLANRRMPSHRDFDGGRKEEIGILMRVDARDIRFEGLVIEYFMLNALVNGSKEGRPLDVSDITFHRCVIRNAWTPTDAHAQGLYVNQLRDFRITQCIIDHNGWLNRPQRNPFRQQVYLYQLDGVHIGGNIFSRGSFTDVKIRSDTAARSRDVTIRDNLFFDGLMPIGISGNPPRPENEDILHRNISILGNLFTDIGGGLPNGQQFSTAITVEFAGDVRIADNLLAHRAPGAPDWSAIIVANSRPHGDIQVRHNTIFDWTRPDAIWDPIRDLVPGVTVADNAIDLPADAYVDASRSIESYRQQLGPGSDALIDRIIQQRKHHWDARLTAPAIIEWFQQGFTRRDGAP